jgi:hypothetical protein
MTDLSKCERCGQSCITHYPDGWSVPMDRTGAIVCDSCRERDRQPQGEAVRLFTPAPAQMPGQTVLEVAYGNWTGDGRPRSDPWPFSRENPGT